MLTLTPDEGNAVNARALLASADRQPLGWVPDPLLDFVHDLRASGDPLVTVERANGPEVGPHLRLLARIRGNVHPGYEPFSGPEWATTA